jgi:hypothetical protein
MEILFEDDKQKIFLNSSKEIFVENKKCGTTLRMSVNTVKNGISLACNSLNVRVIKYGACEGLNFEKVKQ